ncbi:hypothetical protein BMS3Abin16_00240 [archaeon BMS3Abin16]|nr:hypothetical protein BMS3Abin16_00240 [archaeon BMS3Abin16]HDY74535.1 hypothetical protein [Euryarchaeota archaeon]
MRKIIVLFVLTIAVSIYVVTPYIDSAPYEVRVDSRGVPIVDYDWLMGRYIGEQRYPVTIADYADKNYKYYVETGDEAYLQRFYANFDWLETNKVVKDGYVVFPVGFDYPFYGCKAGWTSAMAQGLTLKNYLHAYELSDNESYLKTARSIIKSFNVKIEAGGVLYVDPADGGYWYAEYGCDNSPRVLNGFWFALDGLHEYYNSTGDAEALALYLRGLEELNHHLPDFDSGSWTYYDLGAYPSDHVYHNLNVQIMRELYNQTGDELYYEYGDRWSKYNYSSFRFGRMLTKNLIRRFLVTF